VETVTSWFELLGVGSLIVALIMWRIGKMDKAQEGREAARVKENALIIKDLQAVGHVSERCAIAAQKAGLVNGEMAEALDHYKKTKDDLNTYLIEQNAVRNHG